MANRTLADAAEAPPECRGCGVPITSTRSRKPKRWCAEKCRQKHEKLWGNPVYLPKKGPRRAISYATCAECNQLFVVRRAARSTDTDTHRLCHRPECVKARHDKRTREWASNYQHPEPKRQRRGLVTCTCTQCGTDYQGRKDSLFCSRFCCSAHTSAKYAAASSDSRKNRRERQRLTQAQPVDRIEILQRDSWTCHLCGKKINPRLKYPHQQSASIDHLIPLAQHGTHEPANCRAAHLGCNIRKGDRGGSEQLALIG